MKKTSFLISAILTSVIAPGLLTGCGLNPGTIPGNLNPANPNSGNQQDDVIVRSRAVFQISTDEPSGAVNLLPGSALYNALTGNIPITISNGSNSSMTISTSGISVPTNLIGLLDLGSISLSALYDNDLKKCGNNSNQKCGTALIRMYTTGTAGEGLYNAEDGYGAPITAGQTTLSTVGLNVAGAAIMQSISIPNSKHVLNLSDFPNHAYSLKVDFSNAGDGVYATNLVVEYALAP